MLRNKALVSLWDGVVMGGGVGISIHGTLRVATETTLFAMPETVIGLFPDVGSAYVLSRLPGGLGLYLGLTGARLRGDDLLHCGLATHFVPRKRLPELEDALAADDGNDPGSVVQSFASEGMSEPRSSTLAKSQSWINADFSGAKSVEEIVQRLQARLAASGSAAGTGPPQIVSAECSWARETLQSIGKASPTALKVAHRHIAWAETATLKECFERDFRVIQNLMAAKDFGEGVRARLVDKDNCPAWVPPTLEGVSLFSVDALFSGIGKEELVL